jgi:serine/threonine-protein kinase
MVSYEGEVKVIDFGIAKSMARSVSTAAPTVMGKLGYMAPEQAKGELVDHRADQYALGIVLWELLANQPYVPRGTVTEMVAAMTHATPKPVIPLRPEVPPSLEVAIQRALSPSPDARFPTTDDFARALMESLTRLSALPSKLDVGEFVKANCADAYRSNRDLLTRISTVRELPTPASIPSTSGAPVALPLTKTASSSLGANMTTAQHAASAFPVPKRGARRLMVLAAITGTAVVAWLLVRGPSSPAPSSLADKPPVAPLPKVQLEGPPVAKPAATDEKVLGTIPPAVDVVQGKVGEVVESKQVTEIFVDDGKTYVRAGVNEGLVVGATLVITGPPVEGKRLKVGTATVMEVFPTMARISLDAAANEAVAPRFAALAITSAKDAGASGQAEKLPAATRTSPRGAMKGVIQLQTTPVWSVFLQNTSKFTWTQCTLFAPGQRRFAFASLIPQGRREFPVGLFVFDATVPQLNNEVQVGCKEGTIRISAQ